jgi:hypothetical protein
LLLNNLFILLLLFSEENKKIQELDSLFYYGYYEQVIEKGENYLQEKELKKNERERILILLAQSYIILGEEAEGKNYFSLLLKLNPKIKLDEKEYPPKIVEIFENLKKELKEKEVIFKKELDKKILIYPGIYQLKNNEKLKGVFFFTMETASLAFLLPSYIFMRNAHNNYLNEKDVNEIEKKYQIYKLSYNLFYSTIITSSLTYIFHLIDITF